MIPNHGAIPFKNDSLNELEAALRAAREQRRRIIERLESVRFVGDRRGEVFPRYMSVRAHAAKKMRVLPDEDVLPTEEELADYCRHCGIPIGNVPDPIFGQLRAFPEGVLDEIKIALTRLP